MSDCGCNSDSTECCNNNDKQTTDLGIVQSDNNNPVLVHVTRGGMVESQHRGAFAVVDVQGNLVMHAGDITQDVYPRSAVKIIQALPMVMSGAVEKYNLTAEELSVACASHSGEKRHTQVVKGMLEKAGLSVDDLECGAHRPTNVQANEDLIRAGETFNALHNNCSGKHTAMLMLAKMNGFDTKGYTDIQHPVQQTIMGTFEALTEWTLDKAHFDKDGCSAPTWALPLVNTALAFAKISDPDATLPADTANAVKTLRNSVIEEPFMVGGTNRCCTRIMEVLKDKAFVKYGAEAVYTASLPEYGLGIALKIDDGSVRAVEVALLRILEEIGVLSQEDKAELLEFHTKPITNWNKFTVGHVEPTF